MGLWLIVASFTIAGSSSANLTNGLTAGIVLLVLGIWAAVSSRGWQNWVVAVIGAWMIVVGYWFPANYVATVVNDIVAGPLVFIACGQETTIEVRKISQPTKVSVSVQPTCEPVQKLYEGLKGLNLGEEMERPMNRTTTYTLQNS